MRMKKFSRFFMSMLAVCSIAACSDDELGNKPVVDPGASTDAVYMNVTVQLPTGPGTRSETNTPDDGDYGTSTGGTEEGHVYENTVKQVLVVLAKCCVDATGASMEGDNEFIGFSYSGENQSSILNFTGNGTQGKITQAISKTVLAKYYKENGDPIDGDAGNYQLKNNKDKVRVYVFCNPTGRLISYMKSNESKVDWIDKMASIVERPTGVINDDGTDGDAIWGKGDHTQGFLMTTAKGEETIKKIPERLKTWNVYDKPGSAFDFSGMNGENSSSTVINNVGAIAVERAVARFDFKDGSSEGNNTYTVVTGENGAAEIKIVLEKMALVNMSKNFYYLRRVSADGLNESAEICGPEKTNNYVVDTDATKKQGAMSDFVFGEHFNFCLGTGDKGDEAWKIDENTRKNWFSAKIADVIKEGGNMENQKDPKYHIWRYVTENTIPKAGEKALQRNGISTGIVFRGRMVAVGEEENTEIGKAINGTEGNSDSDPILYMYENHLYYTWREVRKIAIDNKDKSGGDIFYEVVFGKPSAGCNPTAEVKNGEAVTTGAVYSDDADSPDYWWGRWQGGVEKETGVTEDSAKKKFKELATKAKFTLYQSAVEDGKGGYYCYYFYWNRHNNNNEGSVMGPMEFAVVRNNVYKLAVTKIKQLGHPRITENDPDPVDPEDPDEKGDVYISVSVEVLPWVVRVNNIEF